MSRTKLPPFVTGQILTAAQFNQIIDRVNALDEQHTQEPSGLLVTGIATGLLVTECQTRQVSRRSLLGLNWFRRKEGA